LTANNQWKRFLKTSVLSSKSKDQHLNINPADNGAGYTIELKTPLEIEKIRTASHAVRDILKKLKSSLNPGMSTKSLDDMAAKEIKSLGMKPAFLGYRGYPATACISVNNELVHGIPRPEKIIKEGDIVSIDMGVFYEGYYGDAAITCGAGKINAAAQKLLDVTEESLYKAIEKSVPGKRLGDVSFAVQEYAEKHGFGVVRDYVGHGIGRHLHEDPQVPNFGAPGTGIRLVPGMVYAIEPMLNEGSWQVKTLDDGWTVVTVDNKLCAHFEHVVAITENGNEILTK
jgi:methionyl aminopeptidase